MKKLEMAVLYGGPGGYWDTLIVEVEAPDLAVPHELEELGRKKLYDMEEQGELDEFSGSYLYNDNVSITPVMLIHDDLVVDVRPVLLNAGYWDCECERYYIHKKTRSPAIMIDTGACPICKAVEAEQPDSHANEIGKLCTMASLRPNNPCH